MHISIKYIFASQVFSEKKWKGGGCLNLWWGVNQLNELVCRYKNFSGDRELF